MPLSKPKETGTQDASAEPQGPPPPEPREAVTQPAAPGRHNQDFPFQLYPAVYFLSVFQSIFLQILSATVIVQIFLFSK